MLTRWTSAGLGKAGPEWGVSKGFGLVLVGCFPENSFLLESPSWPTAGGFEEQALGVLVVLVLVVGPECGRVMIQMAAASFLIYSLYVRSSYRGGGEGASFAGPRLIISFFLGVLPDCKVG